MKTEKCPECGRTWAWLSDQACAITIVGHCIVCWDKALDGAFSKDSRILWVRLDQDGIIIERTRRETETGYRVEPCSACLTSQDKSECTPCGGTGSIRVDDKEDG